MATTIDYKHGQIERTSNGTFTASHWVTKSNGSKYLALAGQGYGFTSIESAQAAIDATAPDASIAPTAAEQAHSDAIRGIPSVKRLETLQSDLAEMKRIESQENDQNN